jgi:hypothetical protein
MLGQASVLLRAAKGPAKEKEPSQAARFHLVCLASLIAATAFILTTIDPVTVTIVAVVLGARPSR